MDSIIGLLCVLLPVVFSLIGKKLEKAGKVDVVVPPIPEAEPQEEVTPSLTKPREQHQSRQQRSRTASLKNVHSEEEKPRKKDPIDPKKLVIYSEIMKPKF